LKQLGTTNWNSPNTGATNSSGWTALPGGQNSTEGTVLHPPSNKKYIGYFWTSTSVGTTSANGIFLRWDSASVSNGSQNYSNNKGSAYSVRLIKD